MTIDAATSTSIVSDLVVSFCAVAVRVDVCTVSGWAPAGTVSNKSISTSSPGRTNTLEACDHANPTFQPVGRSEVSIDRSNTSDAPPSFPSLTTNGQDC